MYRVLDEEELLRGTVFIDDPVTEADGRAGTDDDAGTTVGAPPAGVAAPRATVGLPGGGRRRVLYACAGALVLAVLVARVASLLLAGPGASRGGRQPGRSGRAPSSARVDRRVRPRAGTAGGGAAGARLVVGSPAGALATGSRASRELGIGRGGVPAGHGRAVGELRTAGGPARAARPSRPSVSRSGRPAAPAASQSAASGGDVAKARRYRPSAAGVAEEFGFER